MAEASASAGVVGMAQVNAAPGTSMNNTQVDVSKPAFWSVFWFVMALVWLVYVFGRRR